MKTYACVLIGAALLSAGATPLVARLARALRVLDPPGARKVHPSAVPRLGGAAIALAMLGMVAAVLVLNNAVGEAFRARWVPLTAVLGGGLFLFAVGLVDDVRGLRAGAKLLAQTAAAAAVCAAGVRIDFIRVGDSPPLEFGWLAWPLTVLWIVGITNAVNLMDGLDGLAAGIAAVACGVIAAFAVWTGQPIMAVLMLALVGGLLGFLVFNFHPAKIFMGDCGSALVGFVIGASSVLCASKSATLVGLGLPALALGVPIFDTLWSVLRRVLERRSVFSPDRGHVHHRLLAMGLRQRHAVLAMYGVTVLAAGAGMLMMVLRNRGAVLVLATVAVLLVVALRVAGLVRLREGLKALARGLAAARESGRHRRQFEHAVLLMRDAASFEAWWQAACRAADVMGLAGLHLALANRDGTRRDLVWRRPPSAGSRPGSAGAKPGGAATKQFMNMSTPIRHRRAGPPLRLRVEAPVNGSAGLGSLEAAGQQMMLFGRLMDECSLAALPRERRPAPAPPRRSPAETAKAPLACAATTSA
jgi:UDP-GlcNAc:undecaprenyl-phosphate GlcNAc-1-phosphate transferase